MTDDRPTCQTCRFWRPNHHNASRYDRTDGGCRRHPPAVDFTFHLVQVIQTIRLNEDLKQTERDYPLTENWEPVAVAWPCTEDSHWCGEHAPRSAGDPPPEPPRG